MNGEKIADCPLASNGRPAEMCGFHVGMWGRRSRVNCMNGWKKR